MYVLCVVLFSAVFFVHLFLLSARLPVLSLVVPYLSHRTDDNEIRSGVALDVPLSESAICVVTSLAHPLLRSRKLREARPTLIILHTILEKCRSSSRLLPLARHKLNRTNSCTAYLSSF